MSKVTLSLNTEDVLKALGDIDHEAYSVCGRLRAILTEKHIDRLKVEVDPTKTTYTKVVVSTLETAK